MRNVVITFFHVMKREKAEIWCANHPPDTKERMVPWASGPGKPAPEQEYPGHVTEGPVFTFKETSGVFPLTLPYA
jgi:hypothetical protein